MGAPGSWTDCPGRWRRRHREGNIASPRSTPPDRCRPMRRSRHSPTRGFAFLALAASAGILGAALWSQYGGGLLPCELCLAERWSWAGAIVLSLLGILAGPRLAPSLFALVLALVFTAGAALAAYHVGVEHHWFAGPAACTAAAAPATTLAELEKEIMRTQSVRCDVPVGSLFGISLAGWNFLASLAMAILSFAFLAASRRRRRRWR
jgi:disulfide bond formation protein DsbB